MNYGKDILLKIVFKIFDYDSDDLITLHDLISLLKTDQTDFIYQDYETVNWIIRSKDSSHTFDEEVIETNWVTHKGKFIMTVDLAEFGLSKEHQDKLREERWVSSLRINMNVTLL
jgi:hypothetical protein